MFDVAIIGAGPAGSMMARLLGERGYSVALLEEHSQPGHPVNCSGVIGLEAFDRFNLPREHVIREIGSFCFFAPGGATLKYSHPTPLAFAVERARFDVAMAERAVLAGAVLMNGTRVNEIRIDRNQVQLVVNRDNSILKSKFVVIATGAGSPLTEQIGLGAPRKYVLGAQTECDTVPLQEVEIHLGSSVAPSNFAWVIPLAEGRAKVGLICDKDAKNTLKDFLNGPLADRIWSKSFIQCSLLPIDTIPRSFTDRALVVGEAAGQIKSTTCGGIYYALLGAEIAAEVLDNALRTGCYDSSTLSTYEKRWHSLLKKELRIGLMLRSVFAKLSDEKIDSLFDIAQRDGLMNVIMQKINFDWHYELVSSVLQHSLIRALLRPRTYVKFLLHSAQTLDV